MKPLCEAVWLVQGSKLDRRTPQHEGTACLRSLPSVARPHFPLWRPRPLPSCTRALTNCQRPAPRPTNGSAAIGRTALCSSDCAPARAPAPRDRTPCVCRTAMGKVRRHSLASLHQPSGPQASVVQEDSTPSKVGHGSKSQITRGPLPFPARRFSRLRDRLVALVRPSARALTGTPRLLAYVWPLVAAREGRPPSLISAASPFFWWREALRS